MLLRLKTILVQLSRVHNSSLLLETIEIVRNTCIQLRISAFDCAPCQLIIICPEPDVNSKYTGNRAVTELPIARNGPFVEGWTMQKNKKKCISLPPLSSLSLSRTTPFYYVSTRYICRYASKIGVRMCPS